MAVAQAREVSKDYASSEWLGSARLAQPMLQQAQGDKTSARLTLREALAQLQRALGDDAPATREAHALLAAE
jgi:hypothetical protein